MRISSISDGEFEHSKDTRRLLMAIAQQRAEKKKTSC
jgi:hypothetical protein